MGWGSSAALAAVGSTPGSVGSALRQLVDAGDLEHEGPGAYRFVDPLFPEWVARTVTMRAHAFPPEQPDDGAP